MPLKISSTQSTSNPFKTATQKIFREHSKVKLLRQICKVFDRISYFSKKTNIFIITHSEQRNAPTEIMDLNVPATNGNDSPTASPDPPQLSYLDQTPSMRTNNKRLCSQLSPSREEQAGSEENIQLAVQDAIEKAVPETIGLLEKSMQDTIMNTIDSA